jgi:hypothetical protein
MKASVYELGGVDWTDTVNSGVISVLSNVDFGLLVWSRNKVGVGEPVPGEKINLVCL